MKKNISLTNNSGFTLLETSIVLVILSVMGLSLLNNSVKSIQNRAAETTAMDIRTIQDASLAFYVEENRWPDNLDELQNTQYLSSSWDKKNPWDHSYLIAEPTSPPSPSLTISTQIDTDSINYALQLLPESHKNNNVLSSTISPPYSASLSNASSFFSGMVVAWNGTINEINNLVGWQLCDGTNGTPDLRNKFLVGAEQDQAGIAQTFIDGTWTQEGGNVSHNHSGWTEDHILTTDEMPEHNHRTFAETTPHGGPWMSWGGEGAWKSWSGGNGQLITPLTGMEGGNGGHRHGITDDKNLPPYYSLPLICKVNS